MAFLRASCFTPLLERWAVGNQPAPGSPLRPTPAPALRTIAALQALLIFALLALSNTNTASSAFSNDLYGQEIVASRPNIYLRFDPAQDLPEGQPPVRFILRFSSLLFA